MAAESRQRNLQALTPNQSKLLYYRCRQPELALGELARRVGVTKAEATYDLGHLYDKLRLVDLDEEQRQLVLHGTICPIQLRQIANPDVDCPRAARGDPLADGAPSVQAMTAVLLEEQHAAQAATQNPGARMASSLPGPQNRGLGLYQPPPIGVASPWWRTLLAAGGGALLVLLLLVAGWTAGFTPFAARSATAGVPIVSPTPVALATPRAETRIVPPPVLAPPPAVVPQTVIVPQTVVVTQIIVVVVTATPVPSTSVPSTPTATPVMDTKPGTVLEIGQPWVQQGVRVVVADPTWAPRACSPPLTLTLQVSVQNTTSEDLLVQLSDQEWKVTIGTTNKKIPLYQNACMTADWLVPVLRAQETISSTEYGVGDTAALAGIDYLYVHIPSLGDRVSNATWRIKVPH